MWTQKTIRSTQHLPEHFGLIVTDFCHLLENGEGSDSSQPGSTTRVSIRESFPGSAWVITLSGEETTRQADLYAAMSGENDRRTGRYSGEIAVSLLRGGWIRLENNSSDDSWAKLDALWKRLWSELERKGYVEVPFSPPDSCTESREEMIVSVPWDVATLPATIEEVVEFFEQGWDFFVRFEMHDGKVLSFDGRALGYSHIIRTFTLLDDGSVLVTLRGMEEHPDRLPWEPGFGVKVLQFILTPMTTKTKVVAQLLEPGAWPLLQNVLNEILCVYPESERSITQLIEFMEVYLGLRGSRGSGSEPSDPPDKAWVSPEAQEALVPTERQPAQAEAEQPAQIDVEQPGQTAVIERERAGLAGLTAPTDAPPAQPAAQQVSEPKEHTPPPWESIPDQGWNRKAVKMIWDGLNGVEIARKLCVAHKTVLNRTSDLRRIYGSDVVPYLRKHKSG